MLNIIGSKQAWWQGGAPGGQRGALATLTADVHPKGHWLRKQAWLWPSPPPPACAGLPHHPQRVASTVGTRAVCVNRAPLGHGHLQEESA